MPCVNLVSVAGAAAATPLHSTWPDPQSLVEQEPEPDSSNLQPILPQYRADQPAGAWNEREVCSGITKPVFLREGLTALAKMPGHTGYSHLFTNVNVAPYAPVNVSLKKCKLYIGVTSKYKLII